MKKKVLIVDDHSLVRLGLSALLGYQSDMDVAGEAEDGEEAVHMACKVRPDVIVMDLMMPGVDGVEATSRIREKLPDSHILILTTFGTSADVARAIAAGASGAIMKDTSNEDLLNAIRTVAEGGKVFSPEIEQHVKEYSVSPDLTQRQMEILHSVPRGLSNPDIAKQFGYGQSKVKTTLLRTRRKLKTYLEKEEIFV